MIKRLSGVIFVLMISHLAMAEESGAFYGKFRPLDRASDASSNSMSKGRYSGAAGYYPPQSRSGSAVIGPGYPAAGYSADSSQQQRWQKPRFRPDTRYRKGPAAAQHYRPHSGQTDPGYRFRPQGGGNRGYGRFPGETHIIKRQPS